MATKVTFNEVERRITVEKAKDDTIVHFTPKIIMELKRAGQLWTTKVKPRKLAG